MPYASIRLFAMATGMGITLPLLAQVPLQPQWTHTWPYGTDQLSLWSNVPAWHDNHVVVDPVTGLIYATVSDENMLYSPRFELLHTFASDGTDLTGAEPIVLGPEPFAELYDTEFNSSSVTGLMMYDGELFAGLTYMMGGLNFGISWGNHFEGGALAGGRWRIINNADFFSPQTLRPVTDGNLVLLHSPGSPVIYAHDIAGWFQWRSELPAATNNIVIRDGIAYALTGNTMQRIDLASGTLLSEVPMGGSEQHLAIKNDVLYAASGVNSNSVELRKRSMDGAILWEHTFDVGGDYIFITGLVVDDGEGVWATVSLFDDGEFNMVGGILLGVDASGNALPLRSYGDAFHSLATDGNMLYMTGWSDNSSTETFLIGVDIDLVTDVSATRTTAQPDLHAWPLPTSDLLSVRVPEQTDYLQLLDAQGRELGRWPTQHSTATNVLELAGFANGRYLLRAVGAGEVRTAGVVIAR